MKDILPVILFCITPFILVLLLEGLSPFTYGIGLLAIGALLTIHLQARAGVRENRRSKN